MCVTVKLTSMIMLVRFSAFTLLFPFHTRSEGHSPPGVMCSNNLPRCFTNGGCFLLIAGPNSSAVSIGSTQPTNDAQGTGHVRSPGRVHVGCGPLSRRGDRRQWQIHAAVDDHGPVAGRCGAAPCLTTSSLVVSVSAHIASVVRSHRQPCATRT